MTWIISIQSKCLHSRKMFSAEFVQFSDEFDFFPRIHLVWKICELMEIRKSTYFLYFLYKFFERFSIFDLTLCWGNSYVRIQWESDRKNYTLNSSGASTWECWASKNWQHISCCESNGNRMKTRSACS